MKKLLALLLTLAILLMTGCGSTPSGSDSEVTESNKTDVSDNGSASVDNDERSSKNIVISISEGENGYYVLMADAKLGYYEDELVEIDIADPALLSFQVSENFDYGVYLFKLTEGDAMIESLAEVIQELQSTGQYELAAKIQLILDEFSAAGPIVSAST